MDLFLTITPFAIAVFLAIFLCLLLQKNNNSPKSHTQLPTINCHRCQQPLIGNWTEVDRSTTEIDPHRNHNPAHKHHLYLIEQTIITLKQTCLECHEDNLHQETFIC